MGQFLLFSHLATVFHSVRLWLSTETDLTNDNVFKFQHVHLVLPFSHSYTPPSDLLPLLNDYTLGLCGCIKEDLDVASRRI